MIYNQYIRSFNRRFLDEVYARNVYRMQHAVMHVLGTNSKGKIDIVIIYRFCSNSEIKTLLYLTSLHLKKIIYTLAATIRGH